MPYTWEESQLMIVGKLEEMEKDIKTMTDELIKARIEIATLKVKSSMWGGLTGILSGAVAGFVAAMKQH